MRLYIACTKTEGASPFPTIITPTFPNRRAGGAPAAYSSRKKRESNCPPVLRIVNDYSAVVKY